MSSPAVLDFETLLRPISDERPSGAELREDPGLGGLFFQLKDARETARVAESQIFRQQLSDDGMAEDIDPPNWADVRDQATTIISEHSKDLWIAAWLIEALARLHGFAGLRDGFQLTRMMCEQYWDSIHPYPDEDDGITWTVSQLAGLNGEDGDGALIGPINNIPITPSTRSYRPLSTFDLIEAETLSKSPDLEMRERRMEQGAVLSEDFDKVLREATPDQFMEILADIQEAREEFDQLTKVLDKRCGKGPDGYHLSPPSSAISRALDDVHGRIKSLTKGLLATESDEATGEDAEDQVEGRGVSTGRFPDSVANREEAFRTLLKVADFFRRTEPHSPVSYSLEQAVRWGKMSLPDLMQDLIGNDQARNELFRRAGIEAPEESE